MGFGVQGSEHRASFGVGLRGFWVLAKAKPSQMFPYRPYII